MVFPFFLSPVFVFVNVFSTISVFCRFSGFSVAFLVCLAASSLLHISLLLWLLRFGDFGSFVAVAFAVFQFLWLWFLFTSCGFELLSNMNIITVLATNIVSGIKFSRDVHYVTIDAPPSHPSHDQVRLSMRARSS